jgi:hypothetical protein
MEQNIFYRNNLIEYCSYNIEYFVNSTYGKVKDSVYEGNILRFSGYGFGSLWRVESEDSATANINGWRRPMPCENFIIRNNIFDTAGRYQLTSKHTNNEFGPTVVGNTWVMDNQPCSAVALQIDNKTEGWTVESAEEGSLKHFYQANFGKKPMGRQRNSGKHGDHAMLFVRSDKKPNKLSQRITGLTPGKKYSLLFVTADPDNVKKPGNELLKVVFNADISDSRTVADGSYQLVQPGPVATRYKRNENGEAVIDKIIPMPQIVTHKIVFVPEKPEVTITFSDWQDEKTPGGKIGEKRVINFISVNPFFED